ncbi:unnamed protein product, partial [Sphacelaria rigidula]
AGSKHHGLETVTYLSPSDQEAMPYRITKLLPWSHLSRKSVGYLYAIHHGAKVIFDVDDGMHVYTSDNGIPYADNGNVPPASSSYTTASLAHNPYPCFGAPSNVWPRGLSQESTDDPNICDSVANVSNQNLSDGNPRLLGVVQSLVNKYPDVDAKCRLCDGDCGDRQFHFARPLPAAEGDGSAAASAPLKIVPSSAFTPYNAQATLHFSVAFWGLLLPVTVDERVSDIWRSYFTQTLLPSTGAVAAYAYPWVEKLGPQRDTAEDMAAEEYMHEQTGTLVEFLAEYRSRDAETRSARDVTLAERIEALAVTMYEYAIVEEEDVILTHAWLHDILAAGSTPGASAVDDKHHTPRNLSQTARSSATRQLDDIIPTNEELHHSLLLVIAIPSARHERRRAIRESWLAWADDRVAIRFFADFPADDVVGAEDIREALLAEVEEHGDVIIMDLDRGMNFTRRLLWAMEWMSNHYVFEYFIKLDDDYFLCLQRLLAELELMSHTLRQNAPYLYAGHAYCTPGKTRIDEAYLLLSSKLVHRVLDIPNLLCGGHAGLTAGWWFTDGNMANTERDIHWVHDPRLDHHGGLWKADMTSEQQSKVCFHRMGVHHTFAENMGLLWARAKDNPGPMPQKMEELFQYPKYNCPSLETGISNEVFFGDDMQPCQSFKPPPGKIGTLHCGEEGC